MPVTYYFYLTEDYKVRGTITEEPLEFLIGIADIELEDYADLYLLMQACVEATLCQLDTDRRRIEINTKANKDIN